MKNWSKNTFLAAIAALALAATAQTAAAQDTTTTGRAPQPGQETDVPEMPGQGGATDTAGYSGMEREDPSRAPQAETGAVEAAAPGQDAGTGGDPNNFKWTEPEELNRSFPTAPGEGAARAGDAGGQETGAAETTGDTTKWGQEAKTDPEVQNPPGYRGMERDTTMVPPGAADPATPTSRTEQMERQAEGDDPNQNPPGYRGMEQPAELDSAKQAGASDSIEK